MSFLIPNDKTDPRNYHFVLKIKKVFALMGENMKFVQNVNSLKC